MKNKGKNIIKLLIVFVILGALASIAVFGIGPNRTGSAKDVKLGLDLAGGVSITYETVKRNPSAEELGDTIYKLRRRVDGLDTEASVYQEGNNRINVDIPGVKDANKILQELGKAGAILFVDEAGNVVIDGADIENAQAQVTQDQFTNRTEYVVSLTLNAAGTRKFARATTDNVGKVIAIIYDDVVISAPTVNEPITTGKAQISGQNTFEEAEQLASTIRIGALPLELTELRSNVVGAKLGQEAVSTSLWAGLIGFILVILFMIFYYKIPGVAASIALCLYAALMIIALNIFNVTLTLPGIAGIILSIGMAVDANCIIFARIREELATGKTVRSSIKIGFNKAMSAILDGNATTLIAAFVLIFLGTGTIKGFAYTLAIGIVLSMFTALIITKFILNALFGIGLDNEKLYGSQKERKIIPFIQHKAKFFAISLLIILIGFGGIIYNRATLGTLFRYGLDFQGGTSTSVTFNDNFDTNAIENRTEIEALVRGITNDPNVNTVAVEGENTIIIRTVELTIDQRNEIENQLVELYQVDPELIASESISATVSGEMRRDAVIAVIVATVLMLLYIWVRFKNLSFGIAAVLPLVHDVLIVLAVYAVLRLSVGNTFIAVMLTIVGYSINATIVTFDRIRENLKEMLKKETIEDMVNKSITQTLSRTINTSITTLIMVCALYIFGVESIKHFAAPLMLGIISGSYSSICIAGAIWYMLYTKTLKNNA